MKVGTEMKRPPRHRPLKVYAAYVNVHHISWPSRHPEAAQAVTDRLPLPIVATSMRHAKLLAKKMWGKQGNGADPEIGLLYIGPCEEPRS